MIRIRVLFFFAVFSCAVLNDTARAEQPALPVSVFSLNLHGYHPFQELDRWGESREGKLRRIKPALSNFRWDELARGNRKRIGRLATDLRRLAPDFAFFQEVAAGHPDSSKSCDEFLRKDTDAEHGNVAARLSSRLADAGYRVSLVCRGNIGWWTNRESFATERVLRIAPGGGRKVVHDWDSDPYPGGILVEGFGVLARKPWRIVVNETVRAEEGSPAVVQLVAALHPERQTWLAMVNVHAGHKIDHFEQAIAIRKIVDRWLLTGPVKGAEFAGLIVLGDFNVTLFRPEQGLDGVGTAIWEIESPGVFDFRLSGNVSSDLPKLERLERLLLAWDGEGGAAALERVRKGLRSFSALQEAWRKEPSLPGALVEALDAARTAKLCRPMAALDGGCAYERHIDHIFYDPRRLALREAFIPYVSNGRWNLRGLSDHPAAFARFEIQR